MLGIAVASQMRIAFSPCVFLRLGNITLACPMGFLEISLASHAIITELASGFLILVALLVLAGRLWCGWLCPASLAGRAFTGFLGLLLPGLLGQTGLFRKSLRQMQQRVNLRFRLDRNHMLALLAGILLGDWLFKLPVWSVFCPLGIVSRAIIQAAVHFSLRWDMLLLIIPVSILFLSGKSCSCPVGLAHSVISRGNIFFLPRLSVECAAKCIHCGWCAKVCPADLDPAQKSVNGRDCFKCLRCMEICPKDLFSLKKQR
ncbi:MAG: 4Fe-4S binding protein [Desulfovibrio sp.]|nr:4Fe-4S binding protein [Desulfovibrio sp.]